MEKEICQRLSNFITMKTLQLAIHKEYRRDLDNVTKKGHEMVQEVC